MITEGVEDCDEVSKIQGKRLLKELAWLPPKFLDMPAVLYPSKGYNTRMARTAGLTISTRYIIMFTPVYNLAVSNMGPDFVVGFTIGFTLVILILS